MDFQAFVRDIEEYRWNVHGVEVYENGRLLHSYGDTVDGIYPIYSATKTILSIAVGMASDENKFDIKRSVAAYLPSSAASELSPAQRDLFKSISVERFLTMSVKGFPFRPEGDSYLRFSLSCPLEDIGRKVFDYSNIPAYLTGVALTNALDEDLFFYLKRKLFEPLHIEKMNYARCPDGFFYGASGMEMTVHDLSKIGLLLYHNGIFEGNRIVSERYVKEATSAQQMNREGGYGYFIQKYRDGFRISGKWQQKCYVLPLEKLIVTYLSHIEDNSEELLASMEKHILGN